MKHLTPPSKTGLREFRRRFPPKLRDLIGRWELKVPVGREGTPGFLARYEAAASDYEAIVAAAQRKLEGRYDNLDRPLIAYLAEAYRVETLEDDDAGRWDQEGRELFKSVAADLEARGVAVSNPWKGREGERWAAKRQEIVDWLPDFRALRGSGDLDGIIEHWREEAVELADAKGYVVDPNGEGFGQLCRALNDAAIAALEAVKARLEGDEVPTPPEPEPPATGVKPTRTQARVPLLSTFDTYATAQGLSAGVKVEWRRYVELLVEFLGHMGEVTPNDKAMYSDMQNGRVQVYGDTAILTYNFAGLRRAADGKVTPSLAKSSRVYVRDGGRWMLVHANFAPVAAGH